MCFRLLGKKRTLCIATCILLVKYMNDSISLSELHLEELWEMRVFVDEDFAGVTIRHHATDKTYQLGSLFPDQGFLPVEALISEIEVWGLGGKAAKEVQSSYKKREELFTEQRRKVDFKTFGSWDESHEKMMMDMFSDPNAVRREDR
ncbi:hypothetical protein ACB092_11G189900 [Castanea dentata]